MIQETMNTNRTEAFAEKMVATINHAGLALMLSLGHRTGLFDVMAPMSPATSDEIAKAARLSERYVREWLGAMTTAGVVEYDPKDKTYFLPAEHSACLTRVASPNNIAVTMQWIAVLASVEDQVVEAFRHGKGVPYPAYKRFQQVMAEESDQTTVAGLEDHILPLIPGLIDRLRAGIKVLDIGCGSGRALLKLAEWYPDSRFIGYDFSPEGIALANALAHAKSLRNVHFEVRDVANMGDISVFDLVTAFDAIHDQANPAGVLQNISRALKPGGVFLMQDIKACSHVDGNMDLPLGTFTYAISCIHCMSVSLAYGGPGLGAAWGKEKALSMLADAGFRDVTVDTLPHDMINYYYVARREGWSRMRESKNGG
jgi:SAM-dependent methyltransferase